MKILVSTFAYNEGDKIKRTIKRVFEHKGFDFVVVDDGTTDGSITSELQQEYGFKWIKNEERCGIGYSIRKLYEFSIKNKYDIVIVMAGNDKDEPLEFQALLDPIINGRADFVQGSRYLKGGKHIRMPSYRIIATKIHSLLFSLLARKKITDSTNGFRAIRVSILSNKGIDLNQSWLDQYSLEPYIFLKAIKLGYEVLEVPVTKKYPPKGESYTKMKPITGWWSILKPLIYLALGR